jgi:uncharacterized membrane protein
LWAVPFVAWFMLKDALPERLPIHWNAAGVANGWTSKGSIPWYLLLMTGIGIATYLVLRFSKRIDPKRTAQLNENVALKVGIGVVAFMTTVNLLIVIPKNSAFNMGTTIFIMLGCLFAFLGNLMYNIKPNYFIGIRLPWTLENENNWKLTHRLAGAVWFIGGIVCIILGILLSPRTMFPVFIGLTVLLVLIPSVYSFILFQRQKR